MNRLILRLSFLAILACFTAAKPQVPAGNAGFGVAPIHQTSTHTPHLTTIVYTPPPHVYTTLITSTEVFPVFATSTSYPPVATHSILNTHPPAHPV